MAKLKLDALLDDKPVKVTIELPAPLHRDLISYAEALGRETGQQVDNPARLIAPMLARFIASDRAFARIRNERRSASASEKLLPKTTISDVMGT